MAPNVSEPLAEAASAGNVNELETLLYKTQPQPIEQHIIQSLLTIAARESRLQIIDFLLSSYPSVPLHEDTVRMAVYSGSEQLFGALHNKDPSIINIQFDRRGTPLSLACMSRQPPDFLTFLLDLGADPNQDPDTSPFPLASAAAFYNNDVRPASLLLQHGARLAHSGALAAAAWRGNVELVKFLLSEGANQETDQVEVGVSGLAMHIAARKGHVEVVRALAEAGVDLQLKDRDGKTAFEVVEAAKEVDGKDRAQLKRILAI